MADPFQQIFEEVDVFPSIILVEKPNEASKPETARLCTIPREQLRIDDLSLQIEREGSDMALSQLGASGWQLEPKEVFSLLEKVSSRGVPFREFVQTEPLSGIKTGLNDAYLIDQSTYKTLLAGKPNCSSLLRPFLRGQDFGRWHAASSGLWMIVMASSENRDWPWSNMGPDAEAVFAKTYPAIHKHLNSFEKGLKARQDQGRHWWELRSCAYWADFDRPKLMYPEITWRSQWCLDTAGTLCNNTAYFLGSDDLWLLAAANAPITWWFAWRRAVHGKDEALRFIKVFVQDLPIPRPTSEQRQAAEVAVRRLIELTSRRQQTQRTLLDWLRVEYGIAKPSNKLLAVAELDSNTWVSEVKRIRGKKQPLSSAGLHALRDEYTRTLEPTRALATETLTLERTLSNLVNQAYALTPAQIELMWKTAPPRMPIPPPAT
jgi:hypothetical protein